MDRRADCSMALLWRCPVVGPELRVMMVLIPALLLQVGGVENKDCTVCRN